MTNDEEILPNRQIVPRYEKGLAFHNRLQGERAGYDGWGCSCFTFWPAVCKVGGY